MQPLILSHILFRPYLKPQTSPTIPLAAQFLPLYKHYAGFITLHFLPTVTLRFG